MAQGSDLAGDGIGNANTCAPSGFAPGLAEGWKAGSRSRAVFGPHASEQGTVPARNSPAAAAHERCPDPVGTMAIASTKGGGSTSGGSVPRSVSPTDSRRSTIRSSVEGLTPRVAAMAIAWDISLPPELHDHLAVAVQVAGAGVRPTCAELRCRAGKQSRLWLRASAGERGERAKS